MPSLLCMCVYSPRKASFTYLTRMKAHAATVRVSIKRAALRGLLPATVDLCIRSATVR